MEQDGNHFKVSMLMGFFTQETEFDVGGDEYEAVAPFGDKWKVYYLKLLKNPCTLSPNNI